MNDAFQCPWCPCWFCDAAAYDAHMRHFGEREWDHRRFWQAELKRRR